MCPQNGLAFPFCSSKLNKTQKKDLECSNCSSHYKQEEKESETENVR